MKIEKKGQFLVIHEYNPEFEGTNFYKIKISAISSVYYSHNKYGTDFSLVAEGQWFNFRTGTLEDRDKILELIK